MLRLYLTIAFILLVVGAVSYLLVGWMSTPERRLLRQFQRIRQMILDGIDESQRPHVRQLLADCEDHLRDLIHARERLEALSEMADAANELTRNERSYKLDELEDSIDAEVGEFLDEMVRISSEIEFDWRESVERLESYTDELEEQRQVFAQLEEIRNS